MMDPYYAAASGGAAIALIVSIAVLTDAFLDLRAVLRLGLTNGRRAIAINAVRDEISRSVALAVLVVTTWAASILGAERVPPLEPLQFVPRLGILLVVVLFAVDSIADLRFRINLRELYRVRAATQARDDSDGSLPADNEIAEQDAGDKAYRDRERRPDTVAPDDRLD